MNKIGLIPEELHRYTFGVKQNFYFHFLFHTYSSIGIANKFVIIKSFMKENIK